MKPIHKIFSIFALLTLLTMTIATPAMAFDGRSGDKVLIKSGEVINDDLYVTANEFTLDGTVKGDLIVFGTTITINGTVEGDLIAAGQTVIINGTVKDDVRMAGAALQVTGDGVIGGDLVAAGASLETKTNSTTEGELVYAGGQALFAGNVAGDALIGTGALEIRGEFGGDVRADVGEAEAQGPSPSMYMPQSSISIPSVTPGFTISDEAKIAGDLVYTQTKDIKIPSGAVGGTVERTEPVIEESQAATPAQPTTGEKVLQWTLNLLRSIVALVLFGLLLGWLVPAFMKALMGKMQAQPAASFGWGVVAYAAFFFIILLVIVVMIIGGVIFGFLTLSSVSSTIFWLGLLAIFELIVGFVLVTSFLTKILVGWLGGKWILGRFNPALAEHAFWPLLLGVFIVALAMALPFVGWLFGLIVMFLGLGALWLWGRDLWQARKAAA